MSVLKNINQSIVNSLEKYNNNLILEYRRNQVNNLIEFIAIIYKEACKLFEGFVEFVGYEILSPEQKLRSELNSKYTDISINWFTWNLVKYKFRFTSDDKNEEFDVYLNVPYIHNDYIIIDNTLYGLQFLLTDKIFAKNGDIVVVKLLKSPLQFFTMRYTIKDIIENKYFHTKIVAAKIHNKSSRKNYIPVFMYFICKYGLSHALELFNIDDSIISIMNFETKTKLIKEYDIENYYYFKLEKSARGKILKVKKEDIHNSIIVKNIVASIIRVLSKFNLSRIPIENLYNKKDEWYIFLGKLIYGNKVEKAKLYINMEKHFTSLDTYLDPISKRRFESFGLIVNSVYDIMKFMLENLNEIEIKYSRSDMILKRLDTIEQVMIDVFINPLYSKIYNYKNRHSQFKKEEIKRLFEMDRNFIKNMYKCNSISTSIQLYNDCKLFNYLSKVIKPSSTSNKKDEKTSRIIKQLKFNPSYLLVYSPIGYSTNSPHTTGTINPFVTINEFGGFEIDKRFIKYFNKEFSNLFK